MVTYKLVATRQDGTPAVDTLIKCGRIAYVTDPAGEFTFDPGWKGPPTGETVYYNILTGTGAGAGEKEAGPLPTADAQNVITITLPE